MSVGRYKEREKSGTTGDSGQRVDSGDLLAFGADLAAVRAGLLAQVEGRYRLVSWINVRRDPIIPLTEQLATVCRRLGTRMGRQLWSERQQAPFLHSPDTVRTPALSQVVAAINPRPLLRVWIAGLSTQIGIAAVATALQAAPATLIGSTVLAPGSQVDDLVDDLTRARPDVVLLGGGFDNEQRGDQQPLQDLARLLSAALERMEPRIWPAVIFAGNRYAAAAVEAQVQMAAEGIRFDIVENVRPARHVINQADLVQQLDRYHWRLCRSDPDTVRVAQWITAPAQLTSLMRAFTHLTRGWMDLQQLPTLHALYCTEHWWLHVWARRDEPGLRVCYAAPGSRPQILDGWPAPRLVSGDWPVSLWPQPAGAWWDRSGMAPMIATVGQVAPRAMVQVLQSDLLSVLPG
jgi:hypothetical protein